MKHFKTGKSETPPFVLQIMTILLQVFMKYQLAHNKQSAYIIWFTGYYWCGLIGFLFAEMICSSRTSARLDLMPACSSSSVFVCVTQLKWEVFITFCGQKVFVNIHTLVICASSVLPPHCVTRKSSSARTRGDTFNASTLSCCVHVNS